VRVRAAGVNPVDWKMRDGFGQSWLGRPDGNILGFDLAGTVEAIGPGVTRFRAGDAVFGCTSLRRDGAYAEYALPLESELGHKPASLDFISAAAVPTVTLTAWQGLFDLARLEAGQRVLVIAAAGGVGSMAVQLAKWKQAEVTGIASGRNEAYVRELGADDYIDYTATRFEHAGREPYHVIVDNIGGDYKMRSLQVLRPGGFLIGVIDPLAEDLALKHGVRAALVKVRPNAAQLEAISRLFDEGRLKVFVQTVLPLSRFHDAHELSESGRTRGKIVLVPDALYGEAGCG
jgi:NADPH:quinone reductase-like Zn-dependent oxidoreductase